MEPNRISMGFLRSIMSYCVRASEMIKILSIVIGGNSET